MLPTKDEELLCAFERWFEVLYDWALIPLQLKVQRVSELDVQLLAVNLCAAILNRWETVQPTSFQGNEEFL